MKSALITLAAMFFALAPAGGAMAAELKVGGVNLQAVLDGSEAGKKALAELKDKADKERKNLQEKQDAIQKLEKEIDQQRLMLSEAALLEKDRKLRRMKRELELFREDTQQLLQGAQAKVMRKLLGEVMGLIKEYGQKNGYTMILEKGEAANVLGGFVLYMEPSADLTSEIIRIYDEKVKSGEFKPGS